MGIKFGKLRVFFAFLAIFGYIEVENERGRDDFAEN